MDYFMDFALVHAETFEGYRPALHREAPCHALKVVRNGEGYFSKEGMEPIRIVAPALFWQQSGVDYCWGPGTDGWCVDYLKFSGSGTQDFFARGVDATCNQGCALLSQSNWILSSIQDAKQMLNVDPVECGAWLRMFLQQTLLELYRLKVRGASGVSGTGALYRIAEEVRIAPALTYDFHQLAAGMGMSYSHFRKLFRKLTGKPPHEYVISCRIQEAVRLLLGSDMAIKQIAHDVGIADVVYFCRIFKKQMHTSPAAYRKEFGRE